MHALAFSSHAAARMNISPGDCSAAHGATLRNWLLERNMFLSSADPATTETDVGSTNEAASEPRLPKSAEEKGSEQREPKFSHGSTSDRSAKQCVESVASTGESSLPTLQSSSRVPSSPSTSNPVPSPAVPPPAVPPAAAVPPSELVRAPVPLLAETESLPRGITSFDGLADDVNGLAASDLYLGFPLYELKRFSWVNAASHRSALIAPLGALSVKNPIDGRWSVEDSDPLKRPRLGLAGGVFFLQTAFYAILDGTALLLDMDKLISDRAFIIIKIIINTSFTVVVPFVARHSRIKAHPFAPSHVQSKRVRHVHPEAHPTADYAPSCVLAGLSSPACRLGDEPAEVSAPTAPRHLPATIC